VSSLHAFWDAVQAFSSSIAAVSFGALAMGLAFHLTNLVLRSRAWRNILLAAYPKARIAWRSVFGAYASGVGLNGILPARAGDAVKILLVHERVEGARYPTLVSSLVAETAFDFVVAAILLTWAYFIGAADHLPGARLFELSFLFDHPQATLTGLILFGGAVAAALIIYGHRVRRFWNRVGQGLVILTTPRRYLREVVSFQAAGWACRLVAAYFYLRAFHVDATLRNAALVLVVGSIATSLPLTPGGLGPKQAITVVVLAGAASRSNLLAFSVGVEVTVLVFNLVLAAICMGLMLHGFRFREVIAEAKARRASGDAGPPAPAGASGPMDGPPGA